MSEYIEFVNTYNNFDFSPKIYDEKVNRFLFQLENINIHPQNYNVDIIKNYKGNYTWNKVLHVEYKRLGFNSHLINGFPLFDNYYWLKEDDFTPIENKDGICLICRHRPKVNDGIDICHKRVEVFDNIKGIRKHFYGKVPYGGENYKGVIGQLGTTQTYPSSYEKLKKMSEYKFNICFENAYHEKWSVGYLTEKLLDCFKSKTLGIYLGCYNIEEIVPKNLFVDYRDFKNDGELSEYLNYITNEEYEKKINLAYDFINNFNYGDIKILKKILNDGD